MGKWFMQAPFLVYPSNLEKNCFSKPILWIIQATSFHNTKLEKKNLYIRNEEYLNLPWYG